MAKKHKGPRVRNAKAGDRNLFRKLWMAFLEESYNDKDSEIRPTEKNLDKYSTLFDVYVEGELPGVVLFVGESAVLMWGVPGPVPFESDTQQRAIGWGVYVKPEFKDKGYVKLIKTEAIRLLKQMKCDEVILDVLRAADKAELIEDAVVYSTLYRIAL